MARGGDDFTYFKEDREAIVLRPSDFNIRAIFLILFLLGPLYLDFNPGEASHSTLVQQSIVIPLIGVLLFYLTSRSQMRIEANYLKVWYLFSMRSLEWRDVTSVTSGPFGCKVTLKSGKTIHVWFILRTAPRASTTGRFSNVHVAEFVTGMARMTPEGRQSQIHDGLM